MLGAYLPCLEASRKSERLWDSKKGNLVFVSGAASLVERLRMHVWLANLWRIWGFSERFFG
jgi:hypothetical protein